MLLIEHNFKAVIATGLKLGIAIFQSLHYTCCKFCVPPTSALGVAIASVTHGRNWPFRASSWSPTVSGKKIATLSNVGFL